MMPATPSITAFLAVGVGAALGAWLRWGLAGWLNPLNPALPPGTLAANLIGGFGIGLVLAWLNDYPDLPVEVRLFLITGLLGGLTTFSTYSAEVVMALSRGLWFSAGLIALSHMAGSFLATGLGFYTIRLFR